MQGGGWPPSSAHHMMAAAGMQGSCMAPHVNMPNFMGVVSQQQGQLQPTMSSTSMQVQQMAQQAPMTSTMPMTSSMPMTSMPLGYAPPVNPFIGGFHDSVLLYAHALKDLLADGGDPRSGHALTALMWNRTFTGITGEVVIDANGDRASDYSLLDMHPVTGEWHVAYNYYGARKEFEPTEYAIHWPAGRTDPPPDEPECGFRGDDPVCESKEEGGITSATIAIISFSVILVIGGAICFMLYRKMKLESDLRDTWWKVSWQEVNLTKEKGRRSASGLSIPTSAGSAASVIAGQQTHNQIFTKVGTYRAKLVAVRETNHKLDINRKVLMEFNKVGEAVQTNAVWVWRKRSLDSSEEDSPNVQVPSMALTFP
ncbi:PREDICTED: atrial natriuretic peptide receptor 1-like [Priapulus caudatus]|uniref:Atrial natriuretic peptide receptor 1-like n=1 Tax=Priapulus caudatus TaxID=37621 RepID=A0ABM1EKR7_PRICU|nr:PREDICTED: atrial natriuretic peptide receptor 1-like [Priapulus caudatus]